ncbi:MAG: response regulator [candidate division Zixibacteria bacterium]|nr:response regulator [candidate division Zixibacteria bacterium]
MTETQEPFRIIVVDDEEIVLSLIRDTFEEEGYAIKTASNGEEALKLTFDETFDLLITDIRMPGMDGIELVRRVREKQPDIGVIFMTGYANLNSAKNAIKQGAFDYIMKPFEIAEIRKAVKDAIRIKKETEEKSSDHQLSSLSDLNQMLHQAGDHKSLTISFLRFALMHQHTEYGSILYWNREEEKYFMATIEGDANNEQELPKQPLADILKNMDLKNFDKPFILTSYEENPLYQKNPNPELKTYLNPAWTAKNHQMVIVPVIRSDGFKALIMLGFNEDTIKIKEADFKFLSLSGVWLGITLENLSLLKETQKAYARLKELQDETIQLEKMATKGEISAEIGHELNNFLGVIAGNLSLLDFHIRKKHGEEFVKYTATMMETIEKIKKFTSGLMDLRPISSKKDIIAFDKLITEVIDYLKPQKRFRGVTITVDQLDENIFFEADNTQMMQLLYNMFNNAADATQDRDKREIKVAVTREASANQFTFTISDTGVGFPPELLEKAFKEKFTTKKNGHGFGLVVCHRIIEYHGGVLKIDSTPDVGTTIRMTFPIAARQPEPDKVPV